MRFGRERSFLLERAKAWQIRISDGLPPSALSVHHVETRNIKKVPAVQNKKKTIPSILYFFKFLCKNITLSAYSGRQARASYISSLQTDKSQ